MDPKELEAITLGADTMVKIGGMPFMVAAGSTIYGRRSNFDVAKQIERDMALGMLGALNRTSDSGSSPSSNA